MHLCKIVVATMFLAAIAVKNKRKKSKIIAAQVAMVNTHKVGMDNGYETYPGKIKYLPSEQIYPQRLEKTNSLE